MESGGKKTVKRYLKSEKSEEKKTFFCAAILETLLRDCMVQTRGDCCVWCPPVFGGGVSKDSKRVTNGLGLGRKKDGGKLSWFQAVVKG